jgi:acetyltransferase-like isoleucine patch superfamily enzyme
VLKRIYLSPLGRVISWAMNSAAALRRPFIAYGYRDSVSRKFRHRTRVSSSASLVHRDRIAMGDNVWVGHYCHLDGTGGLRIGEGVQFATWSGVLTHGSHDSIRLCGARFIELDPTERAGYLLAPVTIGEYAFVGAGAIILPGITLGRGCRIDAGAIVTRNVPDFAIARGVPAVVIGDVRQIDMLYLDDPRVRSSYFDPAAIEQFGAGREFTFAAVAEPEPRRD